MIIKTLSYDLSPACVCRYGEDYQIRIGAATVPKVLEYFGIDKFKHPKMGYETVLSRKVNDFGLYDYLTIQNISGHYYMSSVSVPVDYWPDCFGLIVDSK